MSSSKSTEPGSVISKLTVPLDAASEEQTEVGNYFVANYPPFSFWKPEY